MTGGLIRASSKESDAFAEITHRLRQYRSMVANYQACRQLYDELFPSCTPIITGMPRVETDTYEPERWAQKRLNQREMMEKSLDAVLAQYTAIENLISSLEPEENCVLTRRYLMGERMEQISDTMHYSIRWCWAKHNSAIRKIIKLEAQNG
jgi:hypothetical protein